MTYNKDIYWFEQKDEIFEFKEKIRRMINNSKSIPEKDRQRYLEILDKLNTKEALQIMKELILTKQAISYLSRSLLRL